MRRTYYVIQIVGVAGTVEQSRGTPVGSYVKSYDPDAHGGLGALHGTRDRALAMRFATPQAAIANWMRQSRVRPLREDGRPNLPATAFSISIEAVEEVEP